jgi:hypothetical protein
MELFDWTQNFIKFMDASKKNILETQIIDNNTIKVIEKNKLQKDLKIIIFYLINNSLKDSIKILKEEKIKYALDNKIFFVCINNVNNVEVLYEEWEFLSKNKNFVIIFCDLNKNSKWIIKPHIHNLVADKDNLKEGLMSLHNGLIE